MRVAYNYWDDRAGLRGYVQLNKYTYVHTYSCRRRAGNRRDTGVKRKKM